MSLTNLFNFNFLKENIKRSRAIILLLILLIPVINVIYYLMNAANTNVFIPEVADTSPLSILGMYIIPVILSLTLFGFIYKRKSSDFVMSLPVSKKQIFISNTIGGIIVLIIMNLVNYIFILIASMLLSNVVLDYRMLFDTLILWTISYIFVFTSTNIAVSISSNKITTVVVTLLVLFLVPFVHTFITSNDFKGVNNSDIYTYCDNELCKPTNYECYSTSCEINRRKNLYIYTNYNKVESSTNYTMPYNLIYDFLLGSDNEVINKSIIKMIILSIIYIVLGLILFTRKKLEVVETSFKNEKLHILVRSLTTVPIICIYYIILTNSSLSTSDIFTITFLLVLLIAYIIIYDLITRKKITNIIKSLISLLIVGVIVVSLGTISSREAKQINVNDIDKMTILDNSRVNSNGYTKNKELINYIISIHIDNVKTEENYYKNFEIRIDVNKKQYDFRISVTKEQYEHIVNAITNDKTYKETSDKIKEKDIFAIKLNGNSNFILKENKLYTEIINKFKNSKLVRNNNTNYLFTVELLTYDNYEVKTIYYDIEDIEIKEKILNYYNIQTKKAFEDEDINIHSYYVGKYNMNSQTFDENYLSSYYHYENQEINKFMLDNIDNKVDISKTYMYIKFYANNSYNTSQIFVTNKVKELEKLIEEVNEKEDNDIGDTYDKYTY